MAVETIIECGAWDEAHLAELADKAFHAVLAHFDLDSDEIEAAVMGCDDARIAELNTEFRGKPTPTNVLSWPSEERGAEEDGEEPYLPEFDPEDPFGLELGDIAIAYETCQREAEAQNKSFDAHVLHLLVHGTMHLLGFDHVREKDAHLMESIETEILGKMGIADPYSEDDGK
jgi:probable rRNA maturation factor